MASSKNLAPLNPQTGEPFEPLQQTVPFLEADEPRSMLSGAVGAGKSMALAAAVYVDAMTAPGLYFLAAPTYPMLHLSTWLTWQEVVPRAAVKDEKHHETTLINGSVVVGKTLSHAGRLKGPNLSGAGIDELVEAPWASVEQIAMRLRQGGDRYVQRLRGATNPLWGCEAWKRLVARADEQEALGLSEREIAQIMDARELWHVSHATTAGNTHLGERYLTDLTRSMTELDARIWLGGEWLAATGNVYAYNPDTHLVEIPPEWVGGVPPSGPDWVHLLGVDVGSSVENKFACIVISVHLARPKWRAYVWGEYWKANPDLTPASKWMRERLAMVPRGRWVRFIEHNPSVKAELEKPTHVGAAFDLAKKGTERGRISDINRWLLNGNLSVVGVRGAAGGLVPLAPGLVSEWMGLTWEQLAKPNPPNDAADAAEYALWSFFDAPRVGMTRDTRFRR